MTGDPPFVYVECPRDAWQGLEHFIPTTVKRHYLQSLLDAGFRHIDAGSFVSARAVPQMADTEQALSGLQLPEGADIIAIVGNERGLERALAVPEVTTVGYPLSVNDTFQRRNVGMSIADSWPLVAKLQQQCSEQGRGLVVYLSMAFGNPYRETWVARMTVEALQRLRDMGVGRIALADTIGNADAERVKRVLGATSYASDVGLHLHAAAEGWQEVLEVALAHGVSWVEGALAGVGGCPFAAEKLVGNLPTERVVPWLVARGHDLGIDQEKLGPLADASAALAQRYGDGVFQTRS